MASKSKPLLKQTAFAALISIALGILNANAAHESDFAAAIDKLCAQTGLQRVGPVKLLERTDYADLRYYVQVPLLVEGTKHRYKMHLDDNFRITDFEAQGLSFLVDSSNTLLATILIESKKGEKPQLLLLSV